MERAVYKGNDETAIEYNDFASDVIGFWQNRGYLTRPNGFLLNQAPKSLLVVNSTIAPYIDQISPDGEVKIHDVLLQRCVRMNSLGKDNLLSSPDWTTSFVMGGVVTTETDLQTMINETINFFTMNQGILRDKLQITVSPTDTTSLNALQGANIFGIETVYLNENEEKWVTWQFGIPGPKGQGITLSLKASEDDGQFLNIIHIDEFIDKDGQVFKLKRPVIDVGFGIERFINLRGGVKPFETPLYLKIISQISGNTNDFDGQKRLRVFTVADNIRTLEFLLDEDIVPDKKGQGYLARRLARNIFLNLGMLGSGNLKDRIADLFVTEQAEVLNRELELFLKTLSLADKIISKIKPGKFNSVIEASAYLKDTHGIPEEISQVLLQKIFS